MSPPPRLFLSPAVNWIWRTHYHLSQQNDNYSLVTTIPSSGIIVTAACNLPLLFRPNPNQFIVSCVADSPPRFFPQTHVFQSAHQARTNDCHRKGDHYPLSDFMPHWPQPDLIPREPSRGDVFKNIDYFGAPEQLARQMQTSEIREKFASHGFNLRFHFEYYHDYRETDAVLAVRDFSGLSISHKPASKLINAWRAGVPALLGAEEAFRELRESNDDFCEVNSPDEILQSCLHLRSEPATRQRMITRGLNRAVEFSNEKLTARWAQFLTNEVRNAADQWFAKTPTQKNAFLMYQTYRRCLASLRRRVKRAQSVKR